MTMEEPQSTVPKLANIEEGKAPARRLSTAKAAQSFGHILIRGAKARSEKNARMKGAIDGNPPYPPSKLKAANQNWRTNINFGEAKASVSAACVPFYDLFSGAPYYMDVVTNWGDDADKNTEWSRGITEEADRIVREWNSFDFYMQSIIFDLVVFGKAFAVWLDITDWHFEWFDQAKTYVPERTKAHTGKVPCIMFRQSYELHELWEKITSPGAKAVGWNVDACKRAIESAYPPDPNASSVVTGVDWEVLQQRMKENELYEGYRSEVVPVFHFFVVEFGGKVSHYIVPEVNQPSAKYPGSRDETDTKLEFLFEAHNKFDSISDVVSTFFFETHDGSWNGADGIGKPLYGPVQIKNRLGCTIVDSSILRSGINLQAQTADAVTKLNLLQVGPFNIIPPGFAVQQATIMGDIDGAMEVDRMLEQKLSSNTGIYKPKLDRPTGNPRTAREIELNFQHSATLSTSAVNRFYLNLDKFYCSLFAKLSKDKTFRKRLKERDIPMECLDNIKSVRAYRAVGSGSPFMRQEALKNMQPLVPLFPETGRVNWARDVTASMVGQQLVDRYVPIQKTRKATDDEALATIENGVLKIGAPVLWTGTQDNLLHAVVHMQAAAGAASSLQQGGNPVEVLNFLESIGPHILTHLSHLNGDKIRETEVKALQDQWKKLATFTDTLQKQVNAQAQEAAKQQAERAQAQAKLQALVGGGDTETQLEVAQAKLDMQLKQAKAQQAMEQKQEKHGQQLTQKAEDHNQQIAINDAKAAAEIALAAAKAKKQNEDADTRRMGAKG